VTAALLLAAAVATALLCVAVLRRGVTRHELRVYTVALVVVGALALALISGVEITGGVTLQLTTDNWIVLAGPAALAIIALALTWGQA